MLRDDRGANTFRRCWAARPARCSHAAAEQAGLWRCGLRSAMGGLTLRETGEAVGGLDYAAVSIAIQRLVRQAATNRTLRAQMAPIEELLSVAT